jgi:type I restriction enzyme, S subunit
MGFSRWKEYTIQEIAASVFSGGTPSTQVKEYWSGNNSWLSSGETRNKFITKTEKRITEEGIQNSSTKLAQKEDIVIASAGQGNTRGQTSFCNIDTYINQSLISIRSNKKLVDPYFLFYNISGRYNELRQISDGHSIRGSLTTKIISQLKVKLPSLHEQRAIAKILLALDEKIETNNQINENVQSISQLLFKHWFVDFEFPNEEGLPYKSSGGEMFDSELGMIPKGWEIGNLNKIGIFKNGKGIKEDLRAEKGNYYIFGSNGIIGKTNEILQHEPCIVVGRVGAYCGSIQVTLKPCWVTDNAIIALPIEKKYLPYLYIRLLNSSLREKAGGSAQPLINQSILNNIKIVMPQLNLIEKYSDLVFSFMQKIESNIEQNANLANLRDTLLPKLMNGEIDLSNLELN